MYSSSIAKSILSYLILILCHTAIAQVSTLIDNNPRVNDDLFIDSDGIIYSSDWNGTNANGVIVSKIDPHTGTITPFATNLSNPLGLAMDSLSNLYIANFGNGKITKISPSASQSDFANGFNAPSGLIFDTHQNLYVAEFYGNQISKVAPDGSVEIFAAGSPLANPVSLEIDSAGNLYSANFYDGKIIKITPQGTTSIIANLNPNPTYGAVGHLAMHKGFLIATGIGAHKLYRISLPEGTVDVLAGTGIQGSLDGPLLEARFSGPNGIAVSGDTLYISEVWTRDLRKVVLNEQGTTKVINPIAQIAELRLYPNPIIRDFIVEMNVSQNGRYKFQLFNQQGQFFRSLADFYLSPGDYQHNFTLPDYQPSGHYQLLIKKDGRLLATIPFNKL